MVVTAAMRRSLDGSGRRRAVGSPAASRSRYLASMTPMPSRNGTGTRGEELPEDASCQLSSLKYHNRNDCIYRHWFPKRYVHRTAAGSENFFVVTSCATLDAWPLTAFSLPESQLRPPCTSFDPPGGGPLRGWWTTSGHIVVEPRIDGQSVGYMILDTGALLHCPRSGQD